MASGNTKEIRSRRYLNKDFDSFRADVEQYVKDYYQKVIVDTSESGLAGMLIDLNAYIGDVMSFYLDHQYSELDSETAVEQANIERHLARAGVTVMGAAPAVVPAIVYVEVPAVLDANGTSVPDPASMPIVEEASIFEANNGVLFNLIEDIDYNERKADGTLMADYLIGDSDGNGLPISFVLARAGTCISGLRTTESFRLGDFVPFKQISLSNPDVTLIETVYDSNGNVYYQVGDLAEDVVYAAIPNTHSDSTDVENLLQIKPAPYRYTAKTNLGDRTTTITLGGGSATSFEDDAIPDPSTFALPLYGKTTFPRLSLNPDKLLETKTLGVYSPNVDLFVSYRYGGGLDHNIEPGTLRSVRQLNVKFPYGAQSSVTTKVKSSIEVDNKVKARGGDDRPTTEDLRDAIPVAKNSQQRIVSKSDVLARIYTMPSSFGRVFRAGLRNNPNNPLATQLFVVSRDASSNLSTVPDSLKKNLKTYLNTFRMVSDSIDIIDSPIVNLGLMFEITTDPQLNKKTILQSVSVKLRKFFDKKNFQIDQPILVSDIHNLIYNTQGVISVNKIKFENIVGITDGREYSDVYHDLNLNTTKGNAILPPPGGIFELKFPDDDLKGRAI